MAKEGQRYLKKPIITLMEEPLRYKNGTTLSLIQIDHYYSNFIIYQIVLDIDMRTFKAPIENVVAAFPVIDSKNEGIRISQMQDAQDLYDVLKNT